MVPQLRAVPESVQLHVPLQKHLGLHKNKLLAPQGNQLPRHVSTLLILFSGPIEPPLLLWSLHTLVDYTDLYIIILPCMLEVSCLISIIYKVCMMYHHSSCLV